MAKGKTILEAIGVGAAVSAVAGTYKFSEFAVKVKRLHEVAYQNGVFARIIERVRLDLDETERLLALPSIKFALSSNKEKMAWIESCIASTQEALEGLEEHMGRVGRDLSKGKHVSMWHRMRWVLDEHEKVIHGRMELSASHQSLLQVLGFLTSLEPLACCQDTTAAQRFVSEGGASVTDFEVRKRRRTTSPREARYETEIWQEKRDYDITSNRTMPRGKPWPRSRL